MMENQENNNQQEVVEMKSYTEDGVSYEPEGKGVYSRMELNSLIHGYMTVSSTSEWDEDMHPQVDALSVGETTILKSGAGEYIKVTKTADDVFDVENGLLD